MKTATLTLVFLIVTAILALADPFLSADPYTPAADPNLNPVSFIVTGLSAQPITSTAYIQPSTGQIWLMYDLATLPNGTYNGVTAEAVNVFGGVSPASNPPFSFTKGVPGTPSNLQIRQTRPL